MQCRFRFGPSALNNSFTRFSRTRLGPWDRPWFSVKCGGRKLLFFTSSAPMKILQIQPPYSPKPNPGRKFSLGSIGLGFNVQGFRLKVLVQVWSKDYLTLTWPYKHPKP